MSDQTPKRSYQRHGLSGTPQYKIWVAMHQRCRNPQSDCYEDYGGRGITVDSRWDSYANFVEDMGIRPEGGTIERICNDGNYTKSNCKWATRKEQMGNRRVSECYEINGVTKCLNHWAEIYHIHHETVRGRLRRGWELKQALTITPKPATGRHLKTQGQWQEQHVLP